MMMMMMRVPVAFSTIALSLTLTACGGANLGEDPSAQDGVDPTGQAEGALTVSLIDLGTKSFTVGQGYAVNSCYWTAAFFASVQDEVTCMYTGTCKYLGANLSGTIEKGVTPAQCRAQLTNYLSSVATFNPKWVGVGYFESWGNPATQFSEDAYCTVAGFGTRANCEADWGYWFGL
jgi:hypothetical protein